MNDTGVKTWSIQKRVEGRKRRFTLGPYPTLSLSEARSRAAKLLVKVARRLRSGGREAIRSHSGGTPGWSYPAAGHTLYAQAVLSRRDGVRVPNYPLSFASACWEPDVDAICPSSLLARGSFLF